MQTITVSPSTSFNIKAMLAKPVVKKAKQGLTLQSILTAFTNGCGIRKITWVDGFMIYLAHPEGVIMSGNLNDSNRADLPYGKEIGLGNSPSEWEIVDQNYLIKRAVLAKVGKFDNLLNAKELQSLAKNLKITL